MLKNIKELRGIKEQSKETLDLFLLGHTKGV